MTSDDYKFLRTSFDRIEILLGRIVEALEKKNTKPKLSHVDGAALKLADLWNEWRVPALAEVKGISPGSTRHKNAVARWREHPSEEYWISVIKRINDSKFCLGQSEPRKGMDKPFTADFEFLVRAETHHKVLEGKYDDRNLSPKPKQIDVTGLLLEKLPE